MGEAGLDWRKMVRRYKLPVTGYISTRGVTYNMTNMVNMAVCYI